MSTTVTVSQQPAAVVQQPTVITQQPAVVTQQPTVIAQQPAVMMQQPAVMMQQPAVMMQQPTTTIQFSTSFHNLPHHNKDWSSVMFDCCEDFHSCACVLCCFFCFRCCLAQRMGEKFCLGLTGCGTIAVWRNVWAKIFVWASQDVERLL